jgi:hypothetical protein
MKNSVAVTRQAFFGEAMQLEKRNGRAWRSDGVSTLVQLVEEFLIAGQKSAVQKCQMKLGVVFFDALALIDRAAGAADAEA